MRRLALILTLAAVTAMVTAVALAAPKYSGSVSLSAPEYKWAGGPGNGVGHGTTAVRCTPGVYECEDVEIDVKDAGTLTVLIKAGAGSNDMDVSIYKEADDGSADTSKAYGEDIATGKDAKATAKGLKPGKYIAQVRFFDAVQGVYDGDATLAGAAAPAPVTTGTPAGSASPAPAATATPKPAAKPSKRAACTKKAKKIKNKAKRKKALKKCKKIKG